MSDEKEMKIGDIVEIYHPELKTEVKYVITFTYGKLRGERYPYRKAEGGEIEWLKKKGRIVGMDLTAAEKITKEIDGVSS